MRRTGRRYRSGRAAENYDIIVIGSGIGGLSLAALMTKLGKRVCVLEQHTLPAVSLTAMSAKALNGMLACITSARCINPTVLCVAYLM